MMAAKKQRNTMVLRRRLTSNVPKKKKEFVPHVNALLPDANFLTCAAADALHVIKSSNSDLHLAKVDGKLREESCLNFELPLGNRHACTLVGFAEAERDVLRNILGQRQHITATLGGKSGHCEDVYDELLMHEVYGSELHPHWNEAMVKKLRLREKHSFALSLQDLGVFVDFHVKLKYCECCLEEGLGQEDPNVCAPVAVYIGLYSSSLAPPGFVQSPDAVLMHDARLRVDCVLLQQQQQQQNRSMIGMLDAEGRETSAFVEMMGQLKQNVADGKSSLTVVDTTETGVVDALREAAEVLMGEDLFLPQEQDFDSEQDAQDLLGDDDGGGGAEDEERGSSGGNGRDSDDDDDDDSDGRRRNNSSSVNQDLLVGMIETVQELLEHNKKALLVTRRLLREIRRLQQGNNVRARRRLVLSSSSSFGVASPAASDVEAAAESAAVASGSKRPRSEEGGEEKCNSQSQAATVAEEASEAESQSLLQ